MDEQIVDLNALLPTPRKIRIGNPPQDIEIQPPKTLDVMRLISLGQKLQTIEQIDPVEQVKVIEDLTNEVMTVVPELKEVGMTIEQMMRVVEIIIDMAMPENVDELKSRGVTADAVKKTP